MANGIPLRPGLAPTYAQRLGLLSQPGVTIGDITGRGVQPGLPPRATMVGTSMGQPVMRGTQPPTLMRRPAPLPPMPLAAGAMRQAQRTPTAPTAPMAPASQPGFLERIAGIDPTSAAGQALGAAAATGLQLSGYRPVPITTAEGLGAMMAAGQKRFAEVQESEAEKKYKDALLELKKLEYAAKSVKEPKQAGYVIRDGVFVGEAVRQNGEVFVRNLKGDLSPVSENDVLMSEEEYKSKSASEKDFRALKKEVEDQTRARKALIDFKNTAGSVREGAGFLVDQFTANLKTAFSEVLGKDYAELSDSELASRLNLGQLNALVGQLRLETVGGGVMTEQDALRIVSRLGGNPGLLRNKEAVQEAIAQVLEAKDTLIIDAVDKYNREVDFGYSRKGFERIDLATIFSEQASESVGSDGSVIPDGIRPEVWAELSPEEKALWTQ